MTSIPQNPLHRITLASVAAAAVMGAVAMTKSLLGSHATADAWLIWGAVAIAPAIAAMSLRVFQIRRDWDVRPLALLMLAFPALLAAALGLEALDAEANHRMLRTAAALLTAAGTAPAAAALIMANRR